MTIEKSISISSSGRTLQKSPFRSVSVRHPDFRRTLRDRCKRHAEELSQSNVRVALFGRTKAGKSTLGNVRPG